jgi:hypothetical protein
MSTSGETDMNDDPLAEAIYRAAEYGSSPVVWGIPEDAVLTPGPGADPWDGMLITHWVPADE